MLPVQNQPDCGSSRAPSIFSMCSSALACARASNDATQSVGDIHDVVAVARVCDRVHHADVRADATDDDALRLNLGKHVRQIRIEECAVTAFRQPHTLIAAKLRDKLGFLRPANAMHGNI